MPAVCYTPLRGLVKRVTELDACGLLPVDAMAVTSKGFFTITPTAETEEGQDFARALADGTMCVDDKEPPLLKRLGLSLELCGVNPELISFLTGNPVELDGSDPVGFRIRSGRASTRFAIEIWSALSLDECDGDDLCYQYALFPNVTGARVLPGPFTNGRQDFTVEGAFTDGGAGWGDGPYLVVGPVGAPTDLPVAMTDADHALIRRTCVPPPEPGCDAVAIDTNL